MLLWEALTQPSNARHQDAARPAHIPRRLPFDLHCAAVTKTGRRCRGRVRPGHEWCLFHDPDAPLRRTRMPIDPRKRARRRLSHLPDGYLRRLTSRAAVGLALDRLYREVRLGVITPKMGQVLFEVLCRILDSGLADRLSKPIRGKRRGKAEKVRPKLSELLTRAEASAWRQAISQAPESFVQRYMSDRAPEPILAEPTPSISEDSATVAAQSVRSVSAAS